MNSMSDPRWAMRTAGHRRGGGGGWGRTVEGAAVKSVDGLLRLGALAIVHVGNAERAARRVKADIRADHLAQAVKQLLHTQTDRERGRVRRHSERK
jgi:hypothetical protein